MLCCILLVQGYPFRSSDSSLPNCSVKESYLGPVCFHFVCTSSSVHLLFLDHSKSHQTNKNNMGGHSFYYLWNIHIRILHTALDPASHLNTSGPYFRTSSKTSLNTNPSPWSPSKIMKILPKIMHADLQFLVHYNVLTGVDSHNPKIDKMIVLNQFLEHLGMTTPISPGLYDNLLARGAYVSVKYHTLSHCPANLVGYLWGACSR